MMINRGRLRVIDLKELWNVGYYKSYTSLDLIMFSLGLETKNIVETKGNIFSLYWEEKDNSKIKKLVKIMFLH